MRKFVFFMLAAMLLTSCEKSLVNDDEVEKNPSVSTTDGKRFTFTVKGDFSEEWKSVTRGYLQADGKDMTDLWVLDYMGDVLVQQIHLTNTDENWVTPSINLAMGTHNIYFVASRGTTPTVNTTNKTITWAKPSDTFWKDYEVTVVSTSNGNRAVTLDRVVTRFRAIVTDAIPTGCASVTIAPASWHTGLNYQTGAPVYAMTDYTTVINIPDSYIGQINTPLSLFGFSGADQWATTITITAKTSGNDVLGTAIIENVPFKANRSTDYSGTLFGGQCNNLGFTLGSDWLNSYEGTW
ncbi:MAG: hypothetical protein IKM58_06010 [Tidjanibacter sp.]|nr:hypothetical protein [Tidjanibacter sp.]